MKTFQLWVILFAGLCAACGGCNDEAETQPNNGSTNGDVEPWVAETCDSNDDSDADGLSGCDDPDCRLADNCIFEPADPASVATATDQAGIVGFRARMAFLYQGDDAIQRGVDESVLGELTMGAVAGKIRDRSGQMLVGASVTAVNKHELGRTYSRGDGKFDFVVAAGADVVLRFEKPGYVPVYRTVNTDWSDVRVIDDIVLTKLNDDAVVVDFTRNQYIAGSVESDGDGTRRTALFVPAGRAATMVMPNGERRSLPRMTVRLTEVTVGQDGENAMPGMLPGASRYTFAAEFHVDEAQAAGADHVEFDAPVYAYVDNFLGFTPGSLVPSGWFDRTNPSWRGSSDGAVIRIASVKDNKAVLDTLNPAEVGIEEAELRMLAEHYEVGDEVWRVPLEHFSSWDFNWPGKIPPGTKVPIDGAFPNAVSCSVDPVVNGSIIGCASQTLGEQLLLNGTPLTLAYQSGRVAGRLAVATIPLRDAPLPDALLSARITMDVAGVHYEAEYNRDDVPIVQEWTWDGTDSFGRKVQGAVPAEIRIEHTFQATYAERPLLWEGRTGLGNKSQRLDEDEETAFAQYVAPDGSEVSLSRSRVKIARTQSIKLGGWNVAREKLGGWTVAPQHRFDPTVPSLHFGSGQNLVARPEQRRLTVVGGKIAANLPAPVRQGEVADGAYLGMIDDVAVMPDGSIFYTGLTATHQLSRITPDGTVEHVIPFVREVLEEESGGRVEDAVVEPVQNLVVAPDGLLYFSSSTAIWRLRDGVIEAAVTTADLTTLTRIPSGDHAFDVDRDGSIVFEFDGRIYRKMPGGQLRQVGGLDDGGLSCGEDPPSGLLASATEFGEIAKVRLKSDGTLLVVTRDACGGHRLLTVGTDGVVHLLPEFNLKGFRDLSVSPSTDEVYVAFQGDGDDPTGVAAAKVREDGTLDFVAGRPLRADEVPVFTLRDGDRASTPHNGARGLDVAPNGQVVFTDGFLIARVRELLPSYTGGDYRIPSADGGEVYFFHADGRHDLTRDAYTGVVTWDFEYEDELLTAVVDREGEVTRIERDADGQPTAVVGPEGVRWSFETNADGFLTTLTSPEGEAWTFGYGEGGLLTSMKSPDPQPHEWTFDYDAVGRLIRDDDATLERTFDVGSETVAFLSGEGRRTEYARSTAGASWQTTVTENLETLRFQLNDGVSETRHPDGTVTRGASTAHPVLPYLASYTSFSGVYTPGGAKSETVRVQTGSTDGDQIVPLADWSEVETNANFELTTTWSASDQTLTRVTGGGRSETVKFDDLGRPVRTESSSSAPVDVTYDETGRVTNLSTAGRTWTMTYDELGYPAAIQGPLGTVQYTRDMMGRITTGTRPDGTEVEFGWDGSSNASAVTPPERQPYQFEFDRRRNITRYETPDGSYDFAYNADYQVTRVTYPDNRAATFDYDTSGRLVESIAPGQTRRFIFDEGTQGRLDATGQLLAVTSDSGVDLEFAHDGMLPTEVAWTGEVAGDVGWSYGDRLLVTGLSVNGEVVPYTYDRDGALTSVGSQAIRTEGGTYRIAEREIGDIMSTHTYDELGQLTSSRTTAGPELLHREYTYDDIGRLTAVTETDTGVEKSFEYTYDLLGQLTEVRVDGALAEAYTYDANGNRLTAIEGSTGTYGPDDSLQSYGARTYTYSGGQLATMTDGGVTTNFTYGMSGELRTVDDGTTRIDYVHDALNRRVGKRIDGTLVTGWLYQDALNPVAELNPDGSVRARFVYGSMPHVPDYMVRDGREYAYITDHLGSVRYLVDTTTGDVAQRLEYDAFGQVLTDSNPGFQPFAFAGGLYDADTTLVRFGVRDYDAHTGRWNARDPIGFGGGQSNLWVYVNNAATNYFDPTGTDRRVTAFVRFALALGLSSVMSGVINGALNSFDVGGDRAAEAFNVGFVNGLPGAVPLAGTYVSAKWTAEANQEQCLVSPTDPDAYTTNSIVDGLLGAFVGAAVGHFIGGSVGSLVGAAGGATAQVGISRLGSTASAEAAGLRGAGTQWARRREQLNRSPRDFINSN